MLFLLTAAGSLPAPALFAQSSASYQIESAVLNAGGNPYPVLTSASFQMSLDAVGDAAAATGLTSASYRSDCGFAPDYVPPGEVTSQTFSSKTLMAWAPEPSVGAYNVYRGLASDLKTNNYGSCLQAGLTTNSCTDSSTPPSGVCWVYLVTAENRLSEEGTSGYTSTGSRRPITGACP